MSDDVFYVGAHSQYENDANGNKKFTGFVPAKFLTINDQPVVDPTPWGSQKHISMLTIRERIKRMPRTPTII